MKVSPPAEPNADWTFAYNPAGQPVLDRPIVADRAARGATRAGSSAAPRKTQTIRVISSGSCQASFYADGQSTANGEAFNPDALTAASTSLPFNTRVRVTNLANGKSVLVRINDRGPYVAGRCLDLSRASFSTIASLSTGVINVKYDVIA
jgi:rare lipoprotein A